MKAEHEQQIRKLGAVNVGCFKCLKRSFWSGAERIETMPELRHFMNEAGEEVAVLAWENKEFEILHVFNPPRKWDRSFIDAYQWEDF